MKRLKSLSRAELHTWINIAVAFVVAGLLLAYLAASKGMLKAQREYEQLDESYRTVCAEVRKLMKENQDLRELVEGEGQ